MEIMDLKNHSFEFTPHDGQFEELQTVNSGLRNPNFKAIVVDGKYIATVGSKYGIIQNSEIIEASKTAFQNNGFEMIPFQQQDDASGRIQKFTFVSPDKHDVLGENYYLSFDVINSYGGLRSLEGELSTFREACTNKLRLGRVKQDVFYLKHYRGADYREVYVNIDRMLTNFSVKIGKLVILNGVKIDIARLKSSKSVEESFGKRVVDQVINVYENNYVKQHGNTAYALLNSFTDVSSHYITSYSGRDKTEKNTQSLFLEPEVSSNELLNFLRIN